MEEQEQRMLKLLENNKGFDAPEKWIDYGLAHDFQKIKAEKRKTCPDCGSGVFSCIGQYIYYSTLLKLNECLRCGLVFSDTLIDPNIISCHFEHAYKDEVYFRDRRRRIFDQIVRLVDRCTPLDGAVLDIGGGERSSSSCSKETQA